MQLQKEEQYLFGKKLKTYSARVVIDLIRNLITYLYEDGLNSLVSLVQEELSCGCGIENNIFSKTIHFVRYAYCVSQKTPTTSFPI